MACYNNPPSYICFSHHGSWHFGAGNLKWKLTARRLKMSLSRLSWILSEKMLWALWILLENKSFCHFNLLKLRLTENETKNPSWESMNLQCFVFHSLCSTWLNVTFESEMTHWYRFCFYTIKLENTHQKLHSAFTAFSCWLQLFDCEERFN